MSTGTHASPGALGDLGCATGTLERALGLGVVRTPAWHALVASWDQLDDGTCRDQRFADFRCVASDDDGFKVFEQLAYRFIPEDELCANPALREVLAWLVRDLDQAEGTGPAEWQARCLRNRTTAHPGRPGMPAPEGTQRGRAGPPTSPGSLAEVAHLDGPSDPGGPGGPGAGQRGGADYTAVVLVRRSGVVGGTTVLHRPGAADPEHRLLLSRPGDFVLTDDRRLQQRASPVALAGRGTTAGHRDVLVVRFARL